MSYLAFSCSLLRYHYWAQINLALLVTPFWEFVSLTHSTQRERKCVIISRRSCFWHDNNNHNNDDVGKSKLVPVLLLLLVTHAVTAVDGRTDVPVSTAGRFFPFFLYTRQAGRQQQLRYSAAAVGRSTKVNRLWKSPRVLHESLSDERHISPWFALDFIRVMSILNGHYNVK